MYEILSECHKINKLLTFRIFRLQLMFPFPRGMG